MATKASKASRSARGSAELPPALRLAQTIGGKGKKKHREPDPEVSDDFSDLSAAKEHHENGEDHSAPEVSANENAPDESRSALDNVPPLNEQDQKAMSVFSDTINPTITKVMASHNPSHEKALVDSLNLQHWSGGALKMLMFLAASAIDARIAEHNRDVEELLAAKGLYVSGTGRARTSTGKTRRAPEFVYAHPENPALRWAGTGAKPKWLKEIEADGGDITQFRRKNPEYIPAH